MTDSSDREIFAQLSALTTEAVNPRTADLDCRSAGEILALLNEEDQSVPLAVRQEIDDIARAVDLVVERLSRGGRLIYVGAGTSGRLGVLDAAECPPTFGTEPELVQGVMAGGPGALIRAVEGAEDDVQGAVSALESRGVGAADVVVGLAASRRTPFVLAALEKARALGAGTILVAMNAAGSIPSSTVDVAVCPVLGPEAIMGSTRLKAGTAQKLILNMISTATMVRLGKVYGNLMVDLRANSRKLTERAKRLIMMTCNVDYEVATRLLAEAEGRVKNAILIGRLGVSREEAEARLERAGGWVRRALGEECP